MKIEETLQKIYNQYHKKEYLNWDPLAVATQFRGNPDLEIVSLVSALFAFGGVKQIIASIERAFQLIQIPSGELSFFLKNSSAKDVQKIFSERLYYFRHRIYIGSDLVMLLLLYQKSLKDFGSLQNHFLSFHSAHHETIEKGLSGLIRDYKKLAHDFKFEAGPYFHHMLNSPEGKSTCKRWVMYLKWMIRLDDGIDLGLWNNSKDLRPDQLVIPLDTHLLNISKRLNLTQRNTPNWAMALEVTQGLKKFDPLDPTRFDFSLCRWGMFEYRKLHE